ncbi:class I SAM-dependent methyltransferase [Arthrobacter sp. CAU 1506]|uniref:class I SAM-dependent methyltransferase n=1 Tax=Arthrobacter sp. CAU 1506 TaxID=2560052 RepID=UPI0010AD1CF5|nr:class I SAM-dependent methyltransferase [Arthrobacter sp. CAU 1506]TJY72580.1 class I SAM-dependent methyltransferase [Arthrobacter sp. CAU 1506]
MGLRSALFAAQYDAAMRQAEHEELASRRAALLSGLNGIVYDVGAGTGANLRHFPPSCQVTAVEPDPNMRKRLEAKVGSVGNVRVVAAGAEALQAEDASVDAVVFTLVLCSVPDQATALAETRRVLKPEGRLLFLEHVRGTGAHATFQDLLRPVWSFAAQGCQLNRNTVAAISAAGFNVAVQDEFSVGPGWLPVNPMVMGTATPEG